MLEVAVHGDDDFASGVVETGGKSGGLAEVAAEVDDEDVGVCGGECGEAGVGVVFGAIVDVDDFVGFGVVLAEGGEVSGEGVVELLDGVGFVVHGDDHGEVGERGGFVPFGGGREGWRDWRVDRVMGAPRGLVVKAGIVTIRSLKWPFGRASYRMNRSEILRFAARMSEV